MGSLSYLDDSVIRVGVDLSKGGAISYLSQSGTDENVVDTHDLGRLIQQSYYAGPAPFKRPEPPWQHTPWNPVQAGDRYGHASNVLAHTNDGKTIYTKTIPMQWALDRTPCACTIETWITIDRNLVRVRNRLINHRPDTRQFLALDQELPALYAVGRLSRLVSYSGSAPFTGGQPIQVTRNCGRVRPFSASEHWAALVDAEGWGLGVINRSVSRMLGGFTCDAGKINAAYLAPTAKEILDANIVYDYSYDLVLGTVRQIRSHAAANPGQSTPSYRFVSDRQNWWYIDATDSGWPIRGALQVRVNGKAPQLIGPEQWWQANDVPQIYVRAAFHTKQDVAEIFWSVPGESFSSKRWLAFNVIPDGRFRTYKVDLAASSAYRGTISGLRLDPILKGEPNDFVEIACISSTSC